MRKTLAWLALIGLVLLGADMATKWAVQAYLPHMRDALPVYPYGGIGILADHFGIEVSINHATNTGAVWGMFAGYQYILLVVRLILIVALLGYLVLGKQTRASLPPLALIVVGAIGNVFDIFFYGHVIDMFHFRFWGWDFAIFNLADALISIGIGWLALLWVFEKRKKRAPQDG